MSTINERSDRMLSRIDSAASSITLVSAPEPGAPSRRAVAESAYATPATIAVGTPESRPSVIRQLRSRLTVSSRAPLPVVARTAPMSG
jgi:hypothetical protein